MSGRETTFCAGAAGLDGRGRFDRDAALRSAMTVFWSKGYEATSISDLTEALGIGVKSLYAAFSSKDALYAEALSCYTTSYEHLVLGRFRKAATARDAARAYLLDSATAMTGADSDLPSGCMVNLGSVGSDGRDRRIPRPWRSDRHGPGVRQSKNSSIRPRPSSPRSKPRGPWIYN